MLRVTTCNLYYPSTPAQALATVDIIEPVSDAILFQEAQSKATQDAVQSLTTRGWLVWWPGGWENHSDPRNACPIAIRASKAAWHDPGRSFLVLVHLAAWARRKVRKGEIGWPDRYFNQRLAVEYATADIVGLGSTHFPAGTFTRNRWLRPAWNLMYSRVLKATMTLASHADYVVCGADLNTPTRLNPGRGKAPVKFIYAGATYGTSAYDALWTVRAAVPTAQRRVITTKSDHRAVSADCGAY